MAKWVKKVESESYLYVCSKCGGEMPYNKYGNPYFTNFCPWCGEPIIEIEPEDDINA